MKTFAAALLVALSGKEVTEDGIKAVLKAAGAKENAAEITNLVNAMKGKKVDQLIKEGAGKFICGGAPAAGAPAEDHADNTKGGKGKDDKGKGKGKEDKGKAKEAKKKEPEPEPEDDDVGFGDLF